jgi:hypothetical protein
MTRSETIYGLYRTELIKPSGPRRTVERVQYVPTERARPGS